MVSYLGYFLLFLGLLLSLFNPNSRFRALSKQLASSTAGKTIMVLVVFGGLSISSTLKVSAAIDSLHHHIPATHARIFG